MIKKQFNTGFLSLLGFWGFHYFVSGNILDLGWLIFFSNISEFFIGRIKGDKADERYLDNCRRAKAFAFDIGYALFYAIWILLIFTKDMAVLTASIFVMVAVMRNVYGITLYRLEEK